MNQGQAQFLGFILERVQEDKVDEARALLADNFKRMAEGTFSHEHIVKFIPKMIALIKPDKAAEVQAVMSEFAQNFNR